jgi:hypothetical protein
MIRALLISVLLTACGIATDNSEQESSANGQPQQQPQVSRDTEAVDRVVASSPVAVTPAEVCELKPDNNPQGAAACNLTGKQALRIEDIGTETLSNGQPNPQYLPVCAFWLEPTVERLFDAGEHFRRTMLSAEQLDKEHRFNGGEEIPELRRCQIPEFEAMKTHLISGSIAPGSQYTQLAGGNTGQEKSLPPVKSSFFKKTSDIGRPSASAEELSAQYQIPYRISILSGPSWGGDNNSYPTLMGAWDIGTVISQLARPVYEVVIGIDGELAVGTTDARTERLRGEDKCAGDLLAATADNFLPRYQKIRQPWIFFRLAVPPNLSKASVVVTREAQSAAAEGEGTRTETAAEEPAEEDTTEEDAAVNKVTTTRVDLDGDGVDDLAVWDDGGAGDDLDYRRNILIYANVGGNWYLVDNDEVYACGC